MRLLAAVAAAVVLIGGCASGSAVPRTAGGPDWPTFRGDAARDGHPPGATLTADQASRLTLAWSVGSAGAMYGTPVVVGNTVIAADDGGMVAAYDLGSGAKVWEHRGLGRFEGSPAVAGGMVVAGTLDGHVYGLSLGDGHQVWDWHAPGEVPAIWASPAVVGGLVVIGVSSQYGDNPKEVGRVAAVDLLTGRQEWVLCVHVDCGAGGGVWSSVAFDGVRGFVGLGNPDDGVLAFDVASGKRLWATSLHPDGGLDLDVGATPIVLTVGGREAVAVGSAGGVFDLLDAASGAVVWSRFLVAGAAVHGLIASPAYDGDSLYVPSASTPTGMFALSPATGQIQWEQVTDLPVYSAPAVGARVLVFGTGDPASPQKGGRLYAMSTTDGGLVWSYDAKVAILGAPSIVGSTVLAETAGGKLLVFRPA